MYYMHMYVNVILIILTVRMLLYVCIYYMYTVHKECVDAPYSIALTVCI